MRKLFTLLLLAGLAGTATAQDAVFSQFYAAPLRLNPAFAGVSSAPRITLNYRSQHTSYPSAFTTFAASYEQPIEETPSSIGLRIMNDRQLEGLYRNIEAALIYSYDVQITREFHARIGFSAGLLTSRLDFDGLIFGDILDPRNGATGVTEEQLAAVSKTAADFGVGVLFYAQNLYGGFSVEHLNRPDEILVELDNNLYAGRPQRFSAHAGAQIDVKRYSNRRRPAYITPNILFTNQAAFKQLNLGAYFGYGIVAFGGWYRHAFENPDGFIAALSFRQDILRVGFSYDSVISGLRSVPGGLGATYEVSLAIDFGDSRELQARRYRDRFNDCLGMFR